MDKNINPETGQLYTFGDTIMYRVKREQIFNIDLPWSVKEMEPHSVKMMVEQIMSWEVVEKYIGDTVEEYWELWPSPSTDYEAVCSCEKCTRENTKPDMLACAGYDLTVPDAFCNAPGEVIRTNEYGGRVPMCMSCAGKLI